jgi:hypothetical protein
VKLPPKQAVVGLDNLVKVTVFGNDVLTKKDADEDQLYLFFPAECVISAEYLSKNNEFRNNILNGDTNQRGYFEENGRVKAIKFKGVISTGYLAPLSTLREFYTKRNGVGIVTANDENYYNVSQLKVGDEFTTIDGVDICKKYIPKHIYTPGQGGKESRHNKKLKRFDKLVPNQFRFHQNTSHLAKNLHLFNPDDIIIITDKWHGTSAVFSNVLVNVDLGWYERIILKVAETLLGKKIARTKYDNIYASRSIVKNQYINKEQGGGYYGEDIWVIVNKELEGKVEQGVTLYGEIVGYLPSGKELQKGYDYGCISSPITPLYEHKFLVYRITYTKPNGEVIEYSWNQIKEYCKKYSIEYVKELYFGAFRSMYDRHISGGLGTINEEVLKLLQEVYLEKDCPYCKNKVPAEGICVRIDGKSTYSTFKLKSKRFLERETKSLDAGEISMEDLTEQEEYINEAS